MSFTIANDPGIEIKSLLEKLSPAADSFFVLCDEHTAKHCLPVISNTLPSHLKIVTGPGERNKTMHSCEVIWEFLLQHGAGRNALIINLGGGMVTDLGGFVASVYKRGVRFVHIPTTLLAMVDAAHGGKTGIDLLHYKNVIGAFTDPVQTIVSPVFLETLPEPEWKNGFAEILKHGLICDAKLWKDVVEIISQEDSFASRKSWPLRDWIERAISVKSKIVKKDPLESGERMLLNFGHTIGHALETYSLQHHEVPLSHGTAVAAGMICESFISSRVTGISDHELNEICGIINGFFDLSHVKKDSFSALLHIMNADKKAAAGIIRIPLLNSIGNASVQPGVSTELILESLHYYNSCVA